MSQSRSADLSKPVNIADSIRFARLRHSLYGSSERSYARVTAERLQIDRMAVTASTRKRAAPIVALLFLVVLATACGHGRAAPGVASVGSRSTSTSQRVVAAPVTSVPSAAQTAASTEFAACLRKEGLTHFPDPPYSAGS